jgi:hypothetical protein
MTPCIFLNFFSYLATYAFFLHFLSYLHTQDPRILLGFFVILLLVRFFTYSLSYIGKRDLSQHYLFLFVFHLLSVLSMYLHRTRPIVSLFSFCLAPYGFFTVLSFISTYTGNRAVYLFFLFYLAPSAFFLFTLFLTSVHRT